MELEIEFDDTIDLGVIAGLFAGLRPEPRLTVSAWADLHRQLSPKVSAEPGPWRTDRAPYLREIQDALSATSPVQEVIVEKGAQLGLTEAGNNWIGYIIDNAPGPTLMVMPTDETVKRNSKIRIDPMIEATPRLRDKIAPARARDSGNTTYSKEFDGGVLVMTGANSAVGLRSMPVRFLMLDEIDGYPDDLDGEGSPVSLAEARTRTFARRKIYKISTPTTEGTSKIDAEFEASDQRYYFVPCPLCGTYQRLVWSSIVWVPKEYHTAAYKCAHCEELIAERYKPKMLAAGEWRVTRPENINPKRVGYHISSLYSPLGWFSWAEAAEMWDTAQGDTLKLKAFVNTVLGEVWKSKGEAPEWKLLYARREEYATGKVPARAAFVTAGADVQKDRIEIEIVAWGPGRESWSVGYHIVQGDTAAESTWDALAELIATPLIRDGDGAELPLLAVAIDTGYNTAQVYTFCNRYAGNRVIPIKGQEAQATIAAAPRAVQVRKDGKRVGSVKLWNVGVGVAKSELYGWLKLMLTDDGSIPPGYCHFPTEYETHYFKGLTAEQLEYTKKPNGHRKYQWVKKFERNEPLDCRVYARAAAAIAGMDRLTAEGWAEVAGRQFARPVTKGPQAAPQAPQGDADVPAAPASAVKSSGAPAKRGGFWGRR